MLILALFVIAQVLDGMFTYLGVSRGFPEGNVLMDVAFQRYGLVPTLLCVKGISIVLGVFIYMLKGERLVMWLAIVFWVFAVLPWTLVFLGVW